MCGFCCFSMRFIVFIDLLSTVIQPVTLFYIGYLIYLTVVKGSSQSVTAFILLGAIYGLQAIIFIVRRKWEMIFWMLIYILSMPIFSFALPLYAFWHMDDFSWGSTRLVTGENGRKKVLAEEEKFDPDSIPKKKWEEYQAELWEAQTTTRDDRSEISGLSYGTKAMGFGGGGNSGPHSEAGYPASRPMSHHHMMEMPMGGVAPRPMSRNGSRMSLAPSEMFGLGRGGTEMAEWTTSAGPTDDQLLREIREILTTADLMSVTKKSIKLELERRFGINLDARRAYIGSGKSIRSESLSSVHANENDSYGGDLVWPVVSRSEDGMHDQRW